jgi:hypothetical protein
MRITLIVLVAALLIAPPAAAGPQDRVGSLDTKDATLTDVIRHIRKRSGMNIVYGRNAAGTRLDKVWPPIVVTVAFEDVPWEQALHLVAEATKSFVRKRAKNLWEIYRPAYVSLNVERGDFRKIIYELARQADANIVIGNDVPDGLTISARLKDVPFPHAMRTVTRAAGMALVVVDDNLTVGGARTATRGAAAFRDVPLLLSIDRKSASVRDLATMIARMARVKVIVSAGVSKELKISLALRDVTHRAALNKLAAAAKLRLTRDKKRMAWVLGAPAKKK